jgi:hypothetical protein
MNISFAVTDFEGKRAKVLGIRDNTNFNPSYDDSPVPLLKDTVVRFRADIWPLIDSTNRGTVRFTIILPDTREFEGVLENFTVDCIQKYHDEKMAQGDGQFLAEFSVKIAGLTTTA